jgi:uncharacterized membrane protein YfcA
VSLLECLAVLAAGVFAGAINTIVGSGTLVTFPVLLAVGYDPLIANVSNTIGLVPGSISGAVGYRVELAGQRRRIGVLIGAALIGGITGAVLLLSLPSDVFDAVVPALVALAVVLVILQPRLSRALAARRGRARPHGGAPLWGGVLGTGIYGGYFGAAQGVILLALLGITIPDEDLHRLNALKNVLAAFINGIAAIVFVFFASVAWLPAALLAAGSAAGGQLGAQIGRRLSPAVLRAVIVVVGVAAIVQLVS